MSDDPFMTSDSGPEEIPPAVEARWDGECSWPDFWGFEVGDMIRADTLGGRECADHAD